MEHERQGGAGGTTGPAAQPEPADGGVVAGMGVGTAIHPPPELRAVEGAALDQVRLVLPAFDRHRVVPPTMGQQQPDRAGAGRGRAVPEAACDRAIGGKCRRVAAGELPNEAGTHGKAGDEHAAAVEVEARCCVGEDLLEEAIFVADRRPRAERPVGAVTVGARRAVRCQQHIAAGDDRPGQDRVRDRACARATGAVQEQNRGSQGIALVPGRRRREVECPTLRCTVWPARRNPRLPGKGSPREVRSGPRTCHDPCQPALLGVRQSGHCVGSGRPRKLTCGQTIPAAGAAGGSAQAP